jgi:hypothetical protein
MLEGAAPSDSGKLSASSGVSARLPSTTSVTAARGSATISQLRVA